MLPFMSIASLVGCLFIASADAAEPDTTLAAPTHAYVRINDSGELEVISRRPVHVVEEKQRAVMVKEVRKEPRNQTVQVTKDGKTSDETKVVIEDVEVMVPKTEIYSEATIRKEQFLERYPPSANGFRQRNWPELLIYDLSGNRLTVTAVEDRLQDWTLVLISKTGKALDRRFVPLFKPTTIVIGIPTSGPVQPPADASSQTPDATSAASTNRPARPASKPAAVRANETRPQLPNSPEPTYAFAKVWGEKTIALRIEVEKIQPEFYTIPRQEGEIHEHNVRIREPDITQVVRRTIVTHETVKFPTTHVSVTKVPNKDVTTAELGSELETEALAVMSADGKPIDPVWLQNLQEGTLVIVTPSTLVPAVPVPIFGPARLVDIPQSATSQPVPRRPM